MTYLECDAHTYARRMRRRRRRGGRRGGRRRKRLNRRGTGRSRIRRMSRRRRRRRRTFNVGPGVSVLSYPPASLKSSKSSSLQMSSSS
jgi:hypothetical protein